jgi:endonuclease-8
VAEGDTILRAAGRIELALAGERVRVSAPNPRGRAAGVERLDGRRLEGVEARGKNLLLRFGDLVLHSHLGMNGSWRLRRSGEMWRRPIGTAWVVLEGSECDAAQFGGPTLRVLGTDAVRSDAKLAKLGPDVLAKDLDLDRAVRSLRQSDPRLSIGEALLDQRRIAGIGNIFKSEACFAAGLDPRHPVGRLPDAALERAVLAARSLMQEAVQSGRPARAVYRRRGLPCPRCGTPIESTRQGDDARSTYWCPRCQAAVAVAGEAGLHDDPSG